MREPTDTIQAANGATALLWNCDNSELIAGFPTKCAVIADPPYGINLATDYHKQKRSKLTRAKSYPTIVGDTRQFEPAPWLRFSKACFWGANYFAHRLPQTSHWLIWDKCAGVSSNDQADCELAWCSTPGAARIIHHLWKGMLQEDQSKYKERRVHPTQKPIAVMSWCIQQLGLKPGDVVLDPYMGSGSLGVAALSLGCHYLGVEIELQYYTHAVAQLRAISRQQSLFCVPKLEI